MMGLVANKINGWTSWHQSQKQLLNNLFPSIHRSKGTMNRISGVTKQCVFRSHNQSHNQSPLLWFYLKMFKRSQLGKRKNRKERFPSCSWSYLRNIFDGYEKYVIQVFFLEKKLSPWNYANYFILIAFSFINFSDKFAFSLRFIHFCLSFIPNEKTKHRKRAEE